MRSVAWGLFLSGVASGVTSVDFARAQSVSLPPVTVTAPEQRKQARRTEQTRRTESSSRTSAARRAQRTQVADRQQQSTPGLSTGVFGAAPGRGDVSSAVTALPAAVTVMDAPAISRLAVNVYGDLFRSLPGFNISNYGQGAIGYGISLRGYTESEHGATSPTTLMAFRSTRCRRCLRRTMPI